ncbi:protein Jade-1-like isoform X2 [Neltuma alba]|uniref:protein Jade-1-like isoform X2 n=1 Tax=Neltuma alba TaxID=207710 RepID=UPI0010A44213|nr:protein Jade-1-like isoform X2 [Prosopis alba]
MDTNYHGLPPLKRFRLIQQQQELQNQQRHHNHGRKTQDEGASVSGSTLPAKKRKESRDSTFLSDSAVSVCVNTYSLPAKKRVWALQPDFGSDVGVSSIDLNVEYKPSIEEEVKSIDDEANDTEIPPVANSLDVENENENEIQNTEDVDEDDEDGIVCAVCQSTDGDPSDPIVLCDGCDLMVHAACYGNPLVKGIPEGDWFCETCRVSSSSETKNDDENNISCCLCPAKEGAMKPTVDDRWAHIVCALLVPEVFFKDPEGREGIDCSKVPKKRWSEKCYICESSNGCAIVCSEIKCPLAFHVTCGLKEDLSIEYREGKKSTTIVAGFCRGHTELWRKLSGKYKIVAEENK